MAYHTLRHHRLTWINITAPAPADVERLGKEYPIFHPLDLEDCLSRIERPKIDEYDNYLFIVQHFPVWDSKRRVSRAAQVDYFIGAGFVVTVHEGDLKPLQDLFEQCSGSEEIRQKYMESGASYLLHTIIDRLVDNILPMLYKVDANIRMIEDTMFEIDTRKTIQDISIIRRDVISLRRILRPQLSILFNLEQIDRPFIREELDVYFGDILDHLQKARDIIDEDMDIIAGLADTVDALSAHRINEVMRILTVISVLMLPLTLISGILGMNIPLPLPQHGVSFWGTIGAMFLVAFGMLLYFRYRRWL
jgi:magnesium transporter